jgi:NAD+ kinase
LAAGQGFATIRSSGVLSYNNSKQMSKEFKTVAILGRHEDPRVAEPVAVLARYLTKAGIDVLAVADAADDLPVRSVSEELIAGEADLIIAVGGDGTMLYAAGLAGRHDVPLLGINRGRLGFLADVTPDEMLQSLDRILDGEYSQESRMLLHAQLVKNDGNVVTADALNDIVLQRHGTGRMVDFETSIDDKYVNTHSGDGLIIATPTGSTAYALSCGGPIIEPQLDAVVVVPVCPHTLSDRPIVVPASLEVEVRLIERMDTQAEVAADGHSIGAMTADDRLLIGAADKRIKLIHPPGYDFYEILRSKLHWGRDSRVRGDTTGKRSN